ncbi:hypothetical protein ABVF61_18890 [Roseibium sp. HPY-6]|uniref:hypothetical protein n=1 Tax=Roseibium sp. HPY-6 TaxID=3229852 RepID=UPI00338E06D4
MYSNEQFNSVGQVTGLVGESSTPSKKDVFIFDLSALFDPHQTEMSPAFADYLVEFASRRPCYLLANLNYAEISYFVPSRVCRAFEGIFASAGTEMWSQNEMLIRHEHTFSDDLYECVAGLVQQSAYPDKSAPLINCGSATLRVCLAGTRVGRTAKQAYLSWEREHREIDRIVEILQNRFPDYKVCKDTDVSLLVMPRTFSTARVQDHVLQRHKSARLVTYLTPAASDGFAKPMCDAFLETNIVATVAGASDVSQLLSYEMRRTPAQPALGAVQLRLVREA